MYPCPTDLVFLENSSKYNHLALCSSKGQEAVCVPSASQSHALGHKNHDNITFQTTAQT